MVKRTPQEWGRILVEKVSQKLRRLTGRQTRLRAKLLAQLREPTEEVRRAVIIAIAETRKASVRSAVAKALARGHLDEAARLIPWEEIGAQTLAEALPGPMQAAWAVGGKTTASFLRQNYGFAIRFDMTNPAALARATSGPAQNLITTFGTSNIETTRAIITKGFTDGWTTNIVARRMIDEGIGLTPRLWQAVENKRARLLARGMSPAKVAKASERYTKKLLRYRARNVARTEVMRASVQGQLDVLRQGMLSGEIPQVAEKEWVASGATTHAACASLDGTTIPVNESFEGGIDGPPLHPSCLPGWVPVLAVGVVAATVRWYDGDLVVVSTAGDHHFQVSPNHPVLTSSGWMPASTLRVGDHVISHVGRDALRARDDKGEHIEAPIHEIADTLRKAQGSTTRQAPGAATQFHGDGIKAEITVVSTNRKLRDDSETARDKHRVKPHLWWIHLSKRLHRVRVQLQRLFADLASPTRFVGRLHDSPALAGGDLLPHEATRFAVASDLDAATTKETIERGPADVERVRQRLASLSVLVAPDDVVSVRRVPFRGHVYNLQTKDGFFLGGAVPLGNCECTINVWPNGRAGRIR